MTFGEKIQKLRKEAGLSQEELSYQLGVSRQAISKWERDNGYPETEKIVRMSKIFNVTLDYLLNEEGTQAPETAAEQGIYVSREMADGFLLYQKRKYRNCSGLLFLTHRFFVKTEKIIFLFCLEISMFVDNSGSYLYMKP